MINGYCHLRTRPYALWGLSWMKHSMYFPHQCLGPSLWRSRGQPGGREILGQALGKKTKGKLGTSLRMDL